MIASLKNQIALNVVNLLEKSILSENVNNLSKLIYFLPVNKRKKQLYNASIDLNYASILKNIDISIANHQKNVVSALKKEDTSISIQINGPYFSKAVLSDIKIEKNNYGINSILMETFQDIYGLKNFPKNKIIAVEYSSPNIAKPFHVGHLRSTLIGQFICNLLTTLGHNVLSINYLGDWGRQFGLLAVGLKKYNMLAQLEQVTLNDLLEVYIKINQDVAKDISINVEAKNFIYQMENGDAEALRIWNVCRNISLKENEIIYKRLGVKFSLTQAESMFYDKINLNLKSLENRLYKENKDSALHVNLTLDGDKEKVYGVLRNSDGTSLYLSRDIASALQRINQLSAEKLLYIVENGQHLHFTHLSRLLEIVGHKQNGELHVKFGRVEGMSTRSGSVVLLNELLDKAIFLTRKAILSSKTTKINSSEIEEGAEILGLSAIIVNDLKRHRINNYKFDWNEMLNFNGNSGIFLQYTHARLNSLLENSAQVIDLENINYNLLLEDSAIKMIQHMAKYDEILLKSYYEFEACHIVNYLFTLCQLVNVAHRELQIKNQSSDLAKARLLLFDCAKTVLYNGLKLLGIKPLTKM